MKNLNIENKLLFLQIWATITV
uniref:Uncharacterized protein n=1 Tax=Rhizophora mucronata TaxID=61149 RepID=A0A2P2JE64_RHIMU